VTDPFDPAQMPLPPSPTDDDATTPSPLPLPMAAEPIRLGNLHMSSCPGKKVRIGGTSTPVIPGAQIRPGVLRSLRADLSRIASLGIRLVILCLDDTELALLGAPWAEYQFEASQLGLDVLRLPMPEGFAGPDVESVRVDMRRVVEEYTMQGRDVLVHCRGGLGRAGVVAACWAMEVGWLGTVPPLAVQGVQGQIQGRNAGVERASLVLVERAVGLLRRRRSTKAIETAEQVLFLLRYVETMRRGH
jgi:protein-tyrosine phosphatase